MEVVVLEGKSQPQEDACPWLDKCIEIELAKAVACLASKQNNLLCPTDFQNFH